MGMKHVYAIRTPIHTSAMHTWGTRAGGRATRGLEGAILSGWSGMTANAAVPFCKLACNACKEHDHRWTSVQRASQLASHLLQNDHTENELENLGNLASTHCPRPCHDEHRMAKSRMYDLHGMPLGRQSQTKAEVKLRPVVGHTLLGESSRPVWQ